MRITLPIITFALAGATITGCAKTEVSHQHFQRESEVHDMDRFAAAQSAAGARQDGMLYAHHFSGTELNSLGREKLHLMASDKPTTEPLAVYLNTHNDPLSHERESAISKFLLADHGLAAADVQIKTGANPNAGFPSGASLSRLSKTESGAAEGAGESSAANASSAAKPSTPNK
jgi:hypothetical protein